MPVELTASAFIAAIGVNAAISFTNTPYCNAAEVISAMRYLGLSTLRDITPDPAYGPTWSAYNALGAAGIKFYFIPGVGGGTGSASSHFITPCVLTAKSRQT